MQHNTGSSDSASMFEYCHQQTKLRENEQHGVPDKGLCKRKSVVGVQFDLISCSSICIKLLLHIR